MHLIMLLLIYSSLSKSEFDDFDFREKMKRSSLSKETNGFYADTICEREPSPDCGTGRCVVSEKDSNKYLCDCPAGHSQKDPSSKCEGIYIGSFGVDHPCKDGIESEDIVAINSRTLHIKDFHCNKETLKCMLELQHAYFIAHMGTRDIRLKTVHFDQCTGTALPGFFPASLYLELPEDWYLDAMYKLSLHDVNNDKSICHVETTRAIREELSLLEHPEKMRCHYHSRRVNLGRFGAKEKCQGRIHTGEIEAVNSRVLKVNRFHCDGSKEECHRILEAAFFVAKRGKHSVYTKPIVHEVCTGYSLPQFQYSFTVFLELPDHWTVDTMSSLLLWDFNSKRILCRLKLDDELRRLSSLLPKAERSRCKWEHAELRDEL